MAVIKCKMCGGTLEIKNNETVAICEYCGTKQTLPKLDDERKTNLYDRANHFRRNNEFDKAMGIYEQILNEDSTDAESYWSLVLCRYGIEYVEDPATHKRIPTVNRAQYISIFDDEDYKSALQYADGYQKEVYESEAAAINEIQKGILAISQKEEPFDVFICYKETDANGRRTQDSVLATELYHELTREGFKVFFSKITLEDKLGQEYEPYIFAALNSAKVMVVLGTKPEYFNAVWVKNEWSRYLALIKNGARKMLIPAYKDMDPYDLPEEFSHLQAQDMSKLGFMQDLIRGIKKIIGNNTDKQAVRATIVSSEVMNSNVTALLKRGFMALEDGEWTKADDFFEQCLNQNAELAEAYLGKLMAELKVEKKEQLADCKEPFDKLNNYQKAVRFGDQQLKKALEDCTAYIIERNENKRLLSIYNKATNTMNTADSEQAFKLASKDFSSIPGFMDADSLCAQCNEKAEICRKDKIYETAQSTIKTTTYKKVGYANAIMLFQTIPGWKDADEQIKIYQDKLEEIRLKEEADRLESKRKAEEKRIAEEKAAKKRKKIIVISLLTAIVIIALIIVLKTLVIPSVNYNKGLHLSEAGNYAKAAEAFTSAGSYKDAHDKQLYCLYNEGLELLEAGNYSKAAEAFTFVGSYKDAPDKREICIKNINGYTAISSGAFHTVGLKSDGTVVAVGYNYSGQCDVSEWTDIVAISAGTCHTVGLKTDGTVVAVGDNYSGQCDVSEWTDIVQISAGTCHTVGLKTDGTVVAVGDNGSGRCNVSSWKDIVYVSAGRNHTVGLKSDGTVVAVGDNDSGKCDVSSWKDIVDVSAGDNYTVGLKSDGTVVAVGVNDRGQCEVSSWKDIVNVSAGFEHTVCLKSDGTVVAEGDNNRDQRNITNWNHIIAVSAGSYHTVGLKSDGTVIAVGSNSDSQCDVSGW